MPSSARDALDSRKDIRPVVFHVPDLESGHGARALRGRDHHLLGGAASRRPLPLRAAAQAGTLEGHYRSHARRAGPGRAGGAGARHPPGRHDLRHELRQRRPGERGAGPGQRARPERRGGRRGRPSADRRPRRHRAHCPGRAPAPAEGLLRHALRQARGPADRRHLRQGVQADEVDPLPLGHRIQLRHADQGRRARHRGAIAMLLVIGNKNYSSWSLRPWVAMKVFGFDFDEKKIPLQEAGTKNAILAHSPAGKVPVLVDGKTTVWDSLAILEYLAERNRKLWPADAAERANARSLAAEMHSGFPNLSNHMSMNVRKRYAGKGRTPEVLGEVERVKAIWNEAQKPFL